MQEEPKKRRGRPPKVRPENAGINPAWIAEPRPMLQSEHDTFLKHLRAFEVASNRRQIEAMREAQRAMDDILERIMRGAK